MAGCNPSSVFAGNCYQLGFQDVLQPCLALSSAAPAKTVLRDQRVFRCSMDCAVPPLCWADSVCRAGNGSSLVEHYRWGASEGRPSLTAAES